MDGWKDGYSEPERGREAGVLCVRTSFGLLGIGEVAAGPVLLLAEGSSSIPEMMCTSSSFRYVCTSPKNGGFK